jgi:hypothetical protein
VQAEDLALVLGALIPKDEAMAQSEADLPASLRELDDLGWRSFRGSRHG